jgi:hypothetical protein
MAAGERAATMLNPTSNLYRTLLEANATRACWRLEAQRAVELSDDGREVACEYQLCLIDGLIALIRRELLR